MKKSPVVFAAAASAILLGSSAMGAAGVTDNSYLASQGSAGALTVSIAGQAASNDALVMLLDQFRAMREELQMLRGMVEEQGYEIQRLQRDSIDRYTDLDARVSALYQGDAVSAPEGQAPVQSPATAAPAVPELPDTGNTLPAPSTISPPVQGAVPDTATTAGSLTQSRIPEIQPQLMTEQQLYQLALDSLLQDAAYQKSIDEFDQYLAIYPMGRFVTNAHYWKGQAYVNLSMLDRARESFEIIVTQYPDGAKVDDAMYSLGSVYDRLGNPARARELLQEVMTRFPNTSAANLADIYLRSMN